MSTLDLNNYEAPDTKVVEEKNPTEAVAPVTEKPEDAQTGTVVMTGPLSTIFARALSQVLGEDKVNVSTEASAQQMSAILEYERSVDVGGDVEPITVHIDDDALINENPATSFDNLRLALDSKVKGKKYVVLESARNCSGTAAIWTEYAIKNADRVFYSTESFIKFVKGRL